MKTLICTHYCWLRRNQRIFINNLRELWSSSSPYHPSYLGHADRCCLIYHMTWIAGQQYHFYVWDAASNMTPDDKTFKSDIHSLSITHSYLFTNIQQMLIERRYFGATSFSVKADSEGRIKVFWVLPNDWALFHILRPWDHDKAFFHLKILSFLYC